MRPHSVDLGSLPARYRLILCDIWGCVHNGVEVFPAAAALLESWRAQGRLVFLLTNAPRPAPIIQAQLDRLGLNRAAYDSLVTSGDTGLAALRADGLTRVGFIGTRSDRAALAGTGLDLLDGPQGQDVVCTGLPDGISDPADQDDVLRAMLGRDARFHCFNPDRVVVRGSVLDPCAGAIAERYEAMGGRVAWYGKPYAPIYRRCLSMASVSPDEVIAVGDSLTTDFAGAAREGYPFIFVTHGIEAARVDSIGAGELVRQFSVEQGFDGIKPIAVVRELA